MPPWYKRTLSSEDALRRANKHLENARNSKDRRQAQKLCDEAKEALERIDVSKSIQDHDQIAAVYRAHGQLLGKLGLDDEAQLSYNKAEELRTTSQSAPAPLSSVVTTPVLTSSPAVGPSATSFSASGSTRNNKETVISTIFTKDCPPLVTHSVLPGPDERLVSTRQLTFCLALLQATSLPRDSLNPDVRAWLTATEKNQDETDRLKTLATDLIRALARDELKDKRAVAEVVCLAPVLEKDDFRFLLSQFVNAIKNSLLLDIQALNGLALLIQSAAAPGYIDADDLVKILDLLSTHLQETFQQSPQHIYELTIVVSRVLDAMADSNIQGLDRVKLHEPLLSYLDSLKAGKDPYMVYQAAYAYQALLCVPDDEEPWQAALRRSGAVLKGVGGLASAIKGLNVAEFIDGLSTIQEGFQGASQIFGLAQDAYNGVTALMESGQGLLESLKSGLAFSQKRDWYAVLRGADSLIHNGEMTKFKQLVYGAPCRKDLAFQWGLCQRLGYLAANLERDDDSRKDAIAFLGEMYWNDEEWGQEPRIKQCVLDILLRLSQVLEKGPLNIAAENLLKDLATDGNGNKQELYLACIQAGPNPHSWKFASPFLESSSLIDLVQNKPSVEPALRKYQRRRLQEQEQRHAVYIPPQAKPSRESPDEDLFDLTTKVNEFITGNGDEVLLLLGDSGAGKSTFNLELERNLWKVYNTDKKWIPVFVTLPAIDKPEKDLVAKQLRNYDFTEEQIHELKTYRHLLLICDGYDECQTMNNLYSGNRLNQPGEWKVKMVISCRSEFLGSDYRVFFQPGNRNDRKGATQLQEAVVASFTVTKISDYIRSYVAKYQSGQDAAWNVEDYENVIKNIPNLQELVRNPFLLSLALEVLPRLIDLSKDLTFSRISRVALYDQFVEQWVERGQIRLIERSLAEDDRTEFQILSEDGFTRNAIGFVKDLAVAIFDKQNGRPVVEYSPIRDKAGWKAAFFSHGDGKNLLRETCPLSRSGKHYRFIHRSVLEYGFARAVFEPVSYEDDSDGSVEQSDVQKVDGQDGLSADAPTASPLFRKSYVHESSIINFLSERVQQSTDFKNQLHKFIYQSKTDDRFSQAAANAITILIRAGEQFNGADLRGIRVPGADMSGGSFDSAQLQGADLRNTILRSVWLHQADLSGSQMEGATFGEYPFLEVKNYVRQCVFSPDGNLLAIGFDNGTIGIYDMPIWSKVSLPRNAGDDKSTKAGFLSTSGRDDGNARLLDELTGGYVSSLRGHTSMVNSVAFSPSGCQIASGSEDETVRQWDLQTGALIHLLNGHTDAVVSVAYSPSGHQIASSSSDKTVRLWDAQTGELVSSLRGHTDHVSSVAYSPSGDCIASGSYDKTVRLWDAKTGTLTFSLSGHTGAVATLAFSPSGHQIASGSDDATLRLWDAQTGAFTSSMSGHTSRIASVAYSPSGHQVASGSYDKTVRLWDAETGTLISSLSGHTESVVSLVYSPKDGMIASGSIDRTIRLWNTRTSTFTSSRSGHTDSVTSVVYLPGSSQVASGSYDKTVRLWNAETGALASSLNGHISRVISVVCSASGHQIASGSWDQTVKLWDTQTGTLVSTLSGHTNAVVSLAYSPNGHQIASGSDDETIRLWDAKNGVLTSTLSGHAGKVAAVAYSPSGHQIASGSWDNTVRLWDAQTGVVACSLIGHTSLVTSVTYSPDGRQIASGSFDETVRLWDVQTGTSTSSLSGHNDWITCVAYSSNGRWIASGSNDDTVRLWDVDSGECLVTFGGFQDVACGIAWKSSLEGIYVIVGGMAKSVSSWKVVEDGGQVRVVLHWRSAPDALVLSNASFQRAQGLGGLDTWLLRQRKAVDHQSSSIGRFS